MKTSLLVFALTTIFACYGCGKLNAGTKRASTTASESQAGRNASASVNSKIDFSSQIKPILEAKCQPCHFSGGKVYAKLPFDRPETIKTLGTRLFTRIKNEDERRLIRDFLAQE